MMDYMNIIIAGCTVISTVVALVTILGKKFEKINSQFEKISLDLRQLDSRLSRIEGFIERDMVGAGKFSKPTGTE